jgi:hypothetical protein
MPLEKPFDSTLSIDRTMFVKPSMSNHHTLSACGDKGKSAKGTSH